jgi:hypothetical protein
MFTAFLLMLSADVIAGTPFPTVHEPEGKECVEDEDEMRRNHMNYILHQRDETVHEGIRTSKYSLAECIDCHIYPDKEGDIATHDDKEHFCNACHQYASVQIDCFDCHADKPQKYIKRGKKTADIRDQIEQFLVSTSQANSSNGGATSNE